MKLSYQLTFIGFPGGTERHRRSAPATPVVADGLGFAAPAAERVLLEAVRVLEGEPIGLLPVDDRRGNRVLRGIVCRGGGPGRAAGAGIVHASAVAATLAPASPAHHHRGPIQVARQLYTPPRPARTTPRDLLIRGRPQSYATLDPFLILDCLHFTCEQIRFINILVFDIFDYD